MYKKCIKRILDFIFAIILFPIFCVIFAAAGIVIKCEDGGPIFYCAPRLGKNGKIFKMYKFRSMKVNAPDIRNEDGSTYNAEDDERQTKAGKFLRKTSIDEIPQLLNILKGDMSFIGPRPDLVDFLCKFTEQERKKLDMRPGITGYNQAFFRNGIDVHEKFKNDIYYVENVSFRLDARILSKTFGTVVKSENVYHS